MSIKERIKEKAFELGFEDIGFTSVEPLDLYFKELDSRPEMYDWVPDTFAGLDLRNGASLGKSHPWAKSLMVLILNYHRRSFPPQLIGKIGRLYQADDRMIQRDWYINALTFMNFLREQDIRIYYADEIPARMSAARAGVATYGKNCFVYARRCMGGASWLLSIPVLLDVEIESDQPSVEIGCPSWCKNVCISACPTGALYAPNKMNPRKCITYHTYFGDGITPKEHREQMGAWIYGCDRCQEVCPRNQPWMNQKLPEHSFLFERADDFQLDTLLNMTQDHYEEKVWPLLFNIPKNNISKWKMNAARALGNVGDSGHVKSLIRVFKEDPDETVRGMCAWALGKLNGTQSKAALESRLSQEDGLVKEEIISALENN